MVVVVNLAAAGRHRMAVPAVRPNGTHTYGILSRAIRAAHQGEEVAVLGTDFRVAVVVAAAMLRERIVLEN